MKHCEATIGRWISILQRYRKYYVSQQLEPLGIRGGHYIFLLMLSKHDGASQESISNYLKIDKTTTAKALKKLEESGYLNRQKDKTDKRAYQVFLTQKAWDALPVIHRAVREWEKQMLAGITTEEYNLLEALLCRMARNVSDDPELVQAPASQPAD